MREIFTIGCTHFDDSPILTYVDDFGKPIRPGFKNIKEMNDFMLDTWNETVSPKDIVYHVGDVGSSPYVLERLNGRKRLVLGNHDDGKDPLLQKVFQKIMVWRMFPELDVVLTHVPLIIPNKAKYNFNIHAHVHQNPSPTPYHINVSVEQVNYKPMPIELLLERRKKELRRINENKKDV